MQIIDSKDVKISLWEIAKFPLLIFGGSLILFAFAYIYFPRLVEVIIYINTIFILISIVYIILFGVVPLVIKQKKPPYSAAMNSQMISIIIPVFNDGEVLERNLQNLLTLKYSNFEILIIYSIKSTDKTEEIALRFAKEHSKIHAFSENVSKGNALNIGINNAKGDFLLFLDSDTFIYDGFIEHAMNYFVDEDIKCVSANFLGINCKENLVTMVSWAMIHNMNFYTVGINKYLKPVQFNGYGGLLRKSAILECGGFATTSSEEAELALRINSQFPKWKGIYDDHLFCYMYFPIDSKTLYLQQLRWTMGNWKYTIKGLFKIKSMNLGQKFISIAAILMIIIFPMFTIFTTGLSIIQFFVNFFQPDISFGGGLFFFIVGNICTFLSFTALFIYTYPKHRGESRIFLSRKFILSGIFLIMLLCGFIFGIVALNSVKDLVSKSGKEVFIKVDKSKLINKNV
jgi:cellulose synthase/poly-beta-1,6-N-acetylglucosamine synthase-like glycosyltransferase